MKKFGKIILLACGLLVTLAAFPVFAQEKATNKVEINIKPFRDLAELVKQEIATKKVDLSNPFSIEVEGVLSKNGRLKPKMTRFTKSEGNAATATIGKKFIKAIDNSGLFAYLSKFGIEKIKFALVQNDNQIYANIVSETQTSNKAKTIVSGLNIFTQFVQLKEMKNISEDEKILVSGLKASNEDKTLTIKLAYEKSIIQEMIKRKLEEAK